jgi:hypothetical protein
VSFDAPDLDPHVFADLPGVDSVVRTGLQLQIRGDATIVAHIGARLVRERRAPADVRVQRCTLEDCFMALTTGADR